MGRRSGGITGSTSITIQLGLLPDWRKDSTTSSRFHNPQLLLGRGVLQLTVELGRQFVQVDGLQQLLDGLSAHASLEIIFIFLPHVPVFLLREDLVPGQGAIAGIRDHIGGKVQNLLQKPWG